MNPKWPLNLAQEEAVVQWIGALTAKGFPPTHALLHARIEAVKHAESPKAPPLGKNYITKLELSRPVAGPARPLGGGATGTPKAKTTPRRPREPAEETTFRDVVEAWITASATGLGGVLVYLKGDVVWAQNKRDKGLWEPVGLEEGLVRAAEGR
ncbi:hypothetical protein H2199_009167 [Coniosporium tulheliwenetii]|uniref:Uncharacterized protein n=2 Tax=Coniosporium tulheliwenetii TaxID=3383036 RepID=A0ACC2YFM8_9PEZI|nr:hypothetical protein H2199_009159 [Cladosporium sp. JES 115]KAJ9633968.1 hypothetical protein H2199_009167 [Cladosporium sp. JES 115]